MATETPTVAAFGRVRRMFVAIRTKPKAAVGAALIIVFAAVGMAAITAGATERHRSADPVVSESRLSTPAPERVDLFGDSLGYQAEPYLAMFFAANRDYTSDQLHLRRPGHLHFTGTKRVRHPAVGDIELTYEVFDASADSDLRLIVYTTQTGSSSDDALKLLASWSATQAQAGKDASSRP